MGGKLWHRVPGEAGGAQLKEVDPGRLDIGRPTLIYLSGFLTNNNRPGFVDGSIRKIEELLKSAPPDAAQPDIYAWSHKGLSNLFNLARYDTSPESYSSAAGYTLAAGILLPLVAEDFKRLPDGSVQGRARSLEDAARRLRNVTLFGYSAGSIVAQETFNAALEMMKAVGFSEKDTRKLMKEVVLITAGCISRPTHETDRYATVTLVASNDRINRFKNWVWGTIGTARRTISTHYTRDKNTKPLSIRPLSASYAFINAAVRSSNYEYKFDDSGSRVKKYISLLYPGWTGRRSYHELPHYVTTDPDNNDFARIVLHAVTNAVNRAGAPEPLKLLDPPPGAGFSPESQAAYSWRIKQALRPMLAALQK